jgi:hypothetical protein
LGQATIMAAGFGETVKPGQVRMPQICGIFAGITLRRAIRAARRDRILLENQGFPTPVVNGRFGACLTLHLPDRKGHGVAALYLHEAL